jgi:hypothetical protein
MLAQFQSLYPQGCLISELLQIYHGKFIVRASVQVEGITRATGMAAAETLEAAEDQARSRALMVLGINSAPQPSVTLSAEPTVQVQPTPSLATTTTGLKEPAYSPLQNSFSPPEPIPHTPSRDTNHTEPIPYTPSRDTNYAEPSPYTPSRDTNHTEPIPYTPSRDTNKHDFGQHFPVSNQQEIPLSTPQETVDNVSSLPSEDNPLPSITPSNVRPFAPRSYSSTEEIPTQTTPTSKKKKKSEPENLLDPIAKTDVEMQRLGWTPEQGREYLIKTYGKRSRHLLTDDEVQQFLKYLESQPTPTDPLAGF